AILRGQDPSPGPARDAAPSLPDRRVGSLAPRRRARPADLAALTGGVAVSNRASHWQRVNRAHPCTICGRPDRGLASRDGTAAICARTEPAKRCGDAGWLHRLADSTWQPQPRRVRYVPLAVGGRGPDLAQLAAQYQRAVDPGRLYQLASTLDLTT